MFKLANKWQIC